MLRVDSSSFTYGVFMINIRLEYGINSLSVPVPDGSTVHSVINNANFKAVFGFEKVKAYVNGATVSETYTLEDGDVVKLQAASQEKN